MNKPRKDITKKHSVKALFKDNVALKALSVDVVDDQHVVISDDRQKHHYELHYFVHINKPSEAAIFHLIKSKKKKALLIAPYINSALAKRLIEQQVCFIDYCGNVFIEHARTWIVVVGEKPAKPAHKKVGSYFSVAGIKTIFACLSLPGLENETYRTIAKQSGVSLGAVDKVFSSLKYDGKYLKETGKNQRVLINKKELLDKWCVAYAERFVHRQLILRCTAEKSDWWKKVKIQDFNAQWGGEAAASLLTQYLKPGIVTIYADGSLPMLRAKYGLREHRDGDIEIRERFWNFEIKDVKKNIVPPLLVYADLMASGFDRNRETAELIYEEYLADLIEKTA